MAVVRPKVYLPGQPVRNILRAVTPQKGDRAPLFSLGGGAMLHGCGGVMRSCESQPPWGAFLFAAVVLRRAANVGPSRATSRLFSRETVWPELCPTARGCTGRLVAK